MNFSDKDFYNMAKSLLNSGDVTHETYIRFVALQLQGLYDFGLLSREALIIKREEDWISL